MKPAWPLMLLCVVLGACAGDGAKPRAGAFSEGLTFFSYGGYQFAGQVRGGYLRVNVPCCQSYLADDAFKALMLEAVERRMGCLPEAPMFTDGWVGRWQMTARFSCARPVIVKHQ